MIDDGNSEDYTQIRRRGRAVSDDVWIKAFLNRAAHGTLATADNNRPFLNFLTFFYDENENSIYFHTAGKGQTRINIENNPKVCFGIAEIGRFYPGETAMEFSNEYSSVMVYGHAEIIADRHQAGEALQKLLDKYFPHLRPGRDYRAITDRETAITSVYRLKIEQWIGKENSQPDDKPGAFSFEDMNKPAPEDK